MQHDTSPAEDAVLSVLAGTPIENVASSARTSPARLAEAVARYRAAGRAALDVQSDGWQQVNIQFTDYLTAERVFRAYLLPSLSTEPVGKWWFVRKYPCWRLRVRPAAGATLDETIAHITEAIDNAVSWGVAKDWRTIPYAPETIAFGGPAGMSIAHDLFHADSVGVLNYLHLAADDCEEMLDSKATSFLVTALMLRAAGLEWGEQGDVWGQIEARRPLPDDVDPEQVRGMVQALRRLLMTDAGPALTDGPLAPLREWVTEVKTSGQALADAALDGQLQLGLRGILARHVVFHWNRMGFSTRQQAIWARAARKAVLG
ncbi:thiopeptide-type bacteriocin biosynthesis protein [Streptomyces sp. NPDC012510]|uniref:thiopeptide-type bacteriocin biosynthesis protein n=1 Tax=Streptomyces sp. NPDC012510 TaxID=3364838 RepID=UPI0036E60D07